MMVEQVPTHPSLSHWKKKGEKKNKDLGEKHHEAPESRLWVENLVRWRNDEKKNEKKKNMKIPG